MWENICVEKCDITNKNYTAVIDSHLICRDAFHQQVKAKYSHLTEYGEIDSITSQERRLSLPAATVIVLDKLFMLKTDGRDKRRQCSR